MSDVFISYRHENDAHCARVRKLAEQLEAAGLSVIFDAFAEEREFHCGAPPRGWAHWSNHNASTAPSVIAIASSGWFRVFHTSEPLETGKGAAAEAGTVHDRLYDKSGFNDFLCLGYFDEQHDLADLPVVLHKCGRFDLNDDARLASLVQWLQRPLSPPTVVPSINPAEPKVPTNPVAFTRPDGRRVPRQLPPAAVSKFVGRTTPLKQLTKRLEDGLSTSVVGDAGYGKTALAAEAVLAVVGRTAESLAASPFPDGVVFLDLYAVHGQAESVWHTLANTLAGEDFRDTSPAQVRAQGACLDRRVLVIIEGGEEADGRDGHALIGDLLSVLSPENRYLLLTRDITQAHAGAMIRLEEPLAPAEAAKLFDGLTGERVKGAVRDRVLGLLAGHPLALTWAGGLLARDDEDPKRLADEWEADPARLLSDPMQAEHTLAWLFSRSVRGLDETARRALAAAGLLARAPFPIAAIEAAVADAASVGHVREALKRLIQRGLLRRSGADDHREFTHVLGYRFARDEDTSDAGLRQGLAQWLHQHLVASLPANSGPAATLADSLQHSAALLRADHDQQLWEPLTQYLLYGASDRLVSLGRLDWVNAARGAVSAWLDRFPAAKAAETFWQRERYSCLTMLGDLAAVQGNQPEAQRLFGESLPIAQRLTKSDPANAARQYDLSVLLYRLGELAGTQGNLPTAQEHFGEYQRMIQRLAESDAANALWQRDLSMSFNKLGDLATTQGNRPEAQRRFGEALRIRQRLAESDPANAEWQRGLYVSFIKLGDLATAQGNLPESQRLFGEALRIAQRLAESDLVNATWQRDLWVSYWRIADVLEQLHSPEAMDYWRKAHDALASLSAAGLFVSSEDQQCLEHLRGKLKP